MENAEENGRSYEFGPFRLDAEQRLLFRDGRPVPLAPKVVETLLVLVESGGNLVTKDELMRRLWPNTFVEESNLTQNIFVLRRALNESASYIETVPRRGYRLAGEIRNDRAAHADELIVTTRTRTHFTSEEETIDGDFQAEPSHADDPGRDYHSIEVRRRALQTERSSLSRRRIILSLAMIGSLAALAA